MNYFLISLMNIFLSSNKILYNILFNEKLKILFSSFIQLVTFNVPRFKFDSTTDIMSVTTLKKERSNCLFIFTVPCVRKLLFLTARKVSISVIWVAVIFENDGVFFTTSHLFLKPCGFTRLFFFVLMRNFLFKIVPFPSKIKTPSQNISNVLKIHRNEEVYSSFISL